MLRKAREALLVEDRNTRDRVRLVAGTGEDAQRICGVGSFDAVLCHGALMYLEDSGPLLWAVASVARPGAMVSVLTKNAGALAMRPGLEGRYGDAWAAFHSERDEGRYGAVTRGTPSPGSPARQSSTASSW